MHAKSPPTRRLTALALACLLIAAQAQAQPPASATKQGVAVAGQGAKKAQTTPPNKAKDKAKAKAKASQPEQSGGMTAAKRASAAAATSALLTAAASTATATTKPAPATPTATATARVAVPVAPAPSDLMPLPRVIGPLPTSGMGVESARPPAGGVQSDSDRTLNLAFLLGEAARAHPSIQAARLDVRASASDLQAAQRQRWPTVSTVIENQSNNTAVISSSAVRVEQNIWDAGRATARIREAEANISVNEARIYITNQTLSLQIVNAWQSLLAADGRIQVARDTLGQLDKYRQQMTRRVTADVSPPIDLELVQSRMLQTEVELIQALNTRQVALGKLEQYSGVEGLGRTQQRPPTVPGLAETEGRVNDLSALDWFEVASKHPDVHKARQDVLVAQQRIEAKRAENWPQLYWRLVQPVGATNNNVTGFVGLRHTPGAGFSTGLEAQALASRAASLDQAVDTAMRNVLEALYADRDELRTSRSRMLALDKSVQGSRAVLESYGRQFTAGRKTWQDLMNAVRELAQNQYNLVDAHAAMVSAMYRLQIRTGQSPSPVE